MENGTADALGPRLARADERSTPLSPQRAELLDEVRRLGTVTVSSLAASTGLHENTVREHLDGLLELHLVDRQQAARAGRGRPAWEYVARPAPASTSVNDHAALAEVLAAQLASTSSAPAADARAAGRQWGAALVAGEGPESSPADARRRVVRLLEELGFAPQADPAASTVLLHRCPIVDTARRYPEVVCGVHGGLVSAALEKLGAPDDAEAVRLEPFAVPGACILHLRAARPSGS